MKTEGMNRKVLSFIKEWDLTNRGDRILVAVSGGKDSMALLHFLCTERETLGIDIIAAYFDHRIRDQAGENEVLLIRNFCSELGVPLVTGEENVRGHVASGRGESLELVARRLRHDFLFRESEELKADRIALGHHMNDLAETMLMRIARGTGIRGLTGLAPCRGMIVRPFLCLEVQEIISYVTINQIPYSLDDTNVVEVFERNLVRNRILPQLKKLNPGATKSLYRLFENAHDVFNLVSALVQEEISGFRWFAGTMVQKADRLLKTHKALIAEVVREIVSRLGDEGYTPSRERVCSFMSSLYSGKSRWTIEFKGDVKSSRIGSYVFFYRGKLEFPAERKDEVITELPYYGDFSIGRISVFRLSEKPDAVTGMDVSICPEDELRFPLRIRKCSTGDRFVPFGMNEERSVKRVAHDAGESAFLAQMLVLEDCEGRILWVPGVRTSELCRSHCRGDNVVVFSLERR